jgi:DNA-binding CsgD family transcriptional regulator/PAS domain-containing protein
MALDPAFLASLISAIYDAALDDSLWPQVLERVSAFVHGPGAMIFCYDAGLKTGQRFYSWGDDPDFTRSYFDHYAAISPFLPAQLLLDVGDVKSVFELMPQSEFVETRFYREWVKPQGYVDNVFAILDKSSKSYAAIAVTRDTKTGIVDEKCRENMRLIAPHVRRAVMIGNVIDVHKAEAAMLGDAMGSLSSAVYFVDEDARIVFANKAGQELAGDGLVVRNENQMLTAVDAEADAKLKRVFAASANGDAAVGAGGIAVRLPNARNERWLAHVLPLTSGVRELVRRSYAATAAVFVRKASPDTPSAMETVAKLYGLTASELRVLQSVMELGVNRKVADSLGISEATVKTHLQHLFEKTGTHRQSDLIGLVAGSASPFAS